MAANAAVAPTRIQPQAQTAAAPVMTWSYTNSGDPVLAGERVSYSIAVECSSLLGDGCTSPTLTLQLPKSADGAHNADASSFQADASFVKSQSVDPTTGTVTLALDDMTPGQTQKLVVSWAVPNFTTPNGTKLTTSGSLDYIVSGDEHSGPTDPTAGPVATTVNSQPSLNVTKTLVFPANVGLIGAGGTATYELSVCMPGESAGERAWQSAVITDHLDTAPAITAGDQVSFSDAAGGTKSSDGTTLTWNLTDFTNSSTGKSDGYTCADGQTFDKKVTVLYPTSVSPSSSGVTRTVTNNLDATVTDQDGTVIKGHDDKTVTFTGGGSTGTNNLQPYQEAPNPLTVVKGANGGSWSWLDNDNWRLRSGNPDGQQREIAEVERMPCMTNVINDVPTSPANYADLGTGIFASDWTAPTLSDQCKDPAFKTSSFTLASDNGAGAAPDPQAAWETLTVYYWDTVSNRGGSKTITITPAPSRTTISVYGAPSDTDFGLSTSATVTDVVTRFAPTKGLNDASGGSRHQLMKTGVQSQSFIDSSAVAMNNAFRAFLSAPANADGTVPDANPAVSAPSNAQVQNFTAAKVVPTINKTAVGDVSGLELGDSAQWQIVAGNSSDSGQPMKPVVYDVLPNGLSYKPGTVQWTDLGGKSAPAETTEQKKIDGQTRTVVVWTFSDSFQPGETVTGVVPTTVGLDAAEGSHSGNDAEYSAILDQNGPIKSGLNGSDQWDLNNNKNTSERAEVSSVSWAVSAESGAKVVKFVKGSAGDGTWKTEDASIAAVKDDATTAATVGTDADYRIEISNPSDLELQNVVVYDVLPYVGDTAIGAQLNGQARGSDFQVNFQKLLNLPAGVTVEYSTSNNPSRSELYPGATDPGDGTWTSTAPSDPSQVRALRLVVASMDSGQKLDVDFRGVVPTFAFDAQKPGDNPLCADDTAEAWNNIAFQTTSVGADGTTHSLPPAEASRVGIVEKCGELGDRVWNDTNGNGLQDPGEDGAAGVVVQLTDAAGDVVKDADGNPVQATTDTDGLYHFSVPAGSWGVQLTDVPAGTQLTTSRVGDDRAIDSDPTKLNTPTATVDITGQHLTDDTLDAGLVPVPPTPVTTVPPVQPSPGPTVSTTPPTEPSPGPTVTTVPPASAGSGPSVNTGGELVSARSWSWSWTVGGALVLIGLAMAAAVYVYRRRQQG